MATRTARAAIFGRRSKINHYEIALQKSVIEFLRLALPSDAMVVGYVFERTNERDGARAKAMGALDGFPDLFILSRGRFYGIELKWESRTRDNQQVRHMQLRDCGAPVIVCKSIADAERACEIWGIPLRVTTAAR